VGLGRAGAARVRAAESAGPFALRAIVSRRRELSTASWAEVLARSDIAAVAICTENALHAALADEALRAGKHVLVEFPLAIRASDYEELYRLAAERERVLHEEHIELLTPTHRAWRALLAARTAPVQSAVIESRGGLAGWIGDPERAGFASFAGIARLHLLDDLFGPLALRGVCFRRDERSLALDVEFLGARGEALRWQHRRAEGLTHHTQLRVEAEGGALALPRVPPMGALFAEDAALFAAAIARGAPDAVDVARNLRCAHLAQAIEDSAQR
jgi:biliverdin reductase